MAEDLFQFSLEPDAPEGGGAPPTTGKNAPSPEPAGERPLRGGINTPIERYRELRRSTAWTLLAADTAPETIAFLQTLLFDDERTLAESVLIDRLTRLMNRASIETVSRETASGRIAQWRHAGYIIRSLSERDSEPVYELSTGAFEAIRFVSSQNVRRISPTESRLELLIHALKKLVDDTDTDVEKRVARLEREKKAIDERIRALRNGVIEPIGELEVQAQVSDILEMIEALDGDFLRVRDAFHALAEKIHADVMGDEHTRGSVLEKFFAGYDAVAESDAGRTFTAFYRFLASELATREIDELIDAAGERAFWAGLEPRRQDAIAEVENNLNQRARETQRMMKRLASSLRYFVQSREYQENRRLTELIEQTRRLSLAAVQTQVVGTYTPLLEIDQSTASVTSSAACALFDPINAGGGGTLEEAQAEAVDLAALSERLAASEINYAELRRELETCLAETETVTIGQVLERFPASQGIGSVVGLIHLAVQKAAQPVPGSSETIFWTDRLGVRKRGELPLFVFTRASYFDRSQGKTK